MKKVMIMNLIGCSAGTASAIISAMDWISYASLLMSLTGVGAAASAAVWSYRATILGLTRMGKRAAANAL